MHASDLTLDKFQDAATLTAAPTLPGLSAEVRTVLLTGATGFLGRYLALEWLERLEVVAGPHVPEPGVFGRLGLVEQPGRGELLVPQHISDAGTRRRRWRGRGC